MVQKTGKRDRRTKGFLFSEIYWKKYRGYTDQRTKEHWKIIMAPDDIIDYLVVHELCHRLHMDHSKEFWESVERIIPDYKTKERWLKENGTRLDL